MLKETFFEVTLSDVELIEAVSTQMLSNLRAGVQYSEDQCLDMISFAESQGLVKESAMRNSGLLKHGYGMAIDHVAKRATRSYNILLNHQGYTPPKKKLYGDNDGIPTPEI